MLGKEAGERRRGRLTEHGRIGLLRRPDRVGEEILVVQILDELPHLRDREQQLQRELLTSAVHLGIVSEVHVRDRVAHDAVREYDGAQKTLLLLAHRLDLARREARLDHLVDLGLEHLHARAQHDREHVVQHDIRRVLLEGIGRHLDQLLGDQQQVGSDVGGVPRGVGHVVRQADERSQQRHVAQRIEGRALRCFGAIPDEREEDAKRGSHGLPLVARRLEVGCVGRSDGPLSQHLIDVLVGHVEGERVQMRREEEFVPFDLNVGQVLGLLVRRDHLLVHELLLLLGPREDAR